MGERELSTFTCPESKEAMLLKDLGFQQLIRKRGERGQRTAEAARHSGRRACGHRLPLEPVRSVLALLLELRLPERAQDSPRVTSSYHQAPRPREMGREGTELKPASPTSSQLSSEGRGRGQGNAQLLHPWAAAPATWLQGIWVSQAEQRQGQP